jgi:hypothetical protein
LVHPDSVQKYTDIVLDIQRLVHAHDESHKTVKFYVIKECEKTICEVFAGTDKDWDKVSAIGSFLGHLYIKSCINNELMQDWLTRISEDVKANKFKAIDTFLKTLKIVMILLKVKSPEWHSKCEKELERLNFQGKIPSQHKQWVIQVLVMMPSFLPPSFQGHQFTAGFRVENPKTGTFEWAEMRTQPNETQFCDEYLNSLEDEEVKYFEYAEDFDECTTKSDLKKCVLRLVSHLIMRPYNAQIYASATVSKIIPLLNPKNKKVFTDHLSTHFKSEGLKWHQLGCPEKFDWKFCGDAGCFMAELFNFKVLETEIVKIWIEKLIQHVLKGEVEAFKPLFQVLKIVTPRMKIVDPTTLSSYIDQTREALSNSEQVVQRDNYCLMQEISELMPPKEKVEKKSEQAKTDATQMLLIKDFFLNLANWSRQEIKEHLKKTLSSHSAVKALANYFFGQMMKSRDFKFYAKLVMLIDSECSSLYPDMKFSFKNYVLQNLNKNVTCLKPFENPKALSLEQHGLNAIRFLGEMFNATAIQDPFQDLNENLKSYCEMHLLYVLLQTISVSKLTKELKKTLKTKLELLKRNKTEFKDFRRLSMCEDTIALIQELIRTPYKVKDEQLIKSAIESLSESNTLEIAELINSFSLEKIQIISIIEMILAKVKAGDADSKIYAKFVSQLQELSNDPSWISILKQLAIADFWKVSEYQSEDFNHQGAVAIIHFIADLFHQNQFCDDTIIDILVLITSHLNENTVDCLQVLLTSTGPKIKDIESLDRLFEKFEVIVSINQRQELTFIQRTLLNLTELYNNNWKKPNATSIPDPYDKLIEQLIQNVKEQKLTKAVHDLEKLVATSDSQILIPSLWNFIILKRAQAAYLSKLISKIMGSHPFIPFTEMFIEFLDCRISTYNSIPKDELSEAQKERLTNAMTFIVELYNLGAISDGTLESLLRSAKRLPLQEITKLLALLESKVNRSENIQLKAFVMFLNEIVHEGSLSVWKEVKADLREIKTHLNG